MSLFLKRFSLLLVLVFIHLPLHAQQVGGSVRGQVVSSAGVPLPGVNVTLVELRRVTVSDSAGAFRFDNVPAGHYHIRAADRRVATTAVEIDVVAGQTEQVTVILDPTIHREEIVVSATPEARGVSEVYQPVTVVNEEELMVRLQPTLGETLSREPGVNSTFFGPGSSRPVIRGFGGDRIRILEEGIGTGDASNVSPDHAVSYDPASARRIEIVRGPATLLYGSNVVGGVVNILDERIPTTAPTAAVGGFVDLRAGSNADERGATLSLNGALASRLAWHLDFSARRTGDYRTPHGEVEHDDHHDEIGGRIHNSDIDNQSGTLGLSWIADRGFIGVAFSGFDSNYGVPGHGAHGDDDDDDHHHKFSRRLRGFDDDDEDEHEVRIDMKQRRFDVKGETRFDEGLVRNFRFRLGTTDYEHVELEDDEVETTFTNRSWEIRLEASHRQIGPFQGAIGVQLMNRDFSAIGEEAFVPPSTTDNRALFIFEEVINGAWAFQLGARYETQDVTVRRSGLPNRSFSGISSSIGTIWRPVPGYSIAGSLARAVRLPTAEELYSDGPHLATGTFEVGNPFLDEEVSRGLDVAFRKQGGRVRAELSLFANRFDGFIFQEPTGGEEDHLPVFLYEQEDARFHGMEGAIHFDIFHTDPHHFELELGGDMVRARLDDGHLLPRIPPMRTYAALLYRAHRLSSRVEVRRVSAQNRVAEFEDPTDGYTMLNADIGYRFFFGNSAHDIILRGMNLTDEFAVNHVSPLRRVAPLPGRDISLAYRVTF